MEKKIFFQTTSKIKDNQIYTLKDLGSIDDILYSIISFLPHKNYLRLINKKLSHVLRYDVTHLLIRNVSKFEQSLELFPKVQFIHFKRNPPLKILSPEKFQMHYRLVQEKIKMKNNFNELIEKEIDFQRGYVDSRVEELKKLQEELFVNEKVKDIPESDYIWMGQQIKQSIRSVGKSIDLQISWYKKESSISFIEWNQNSVSTIIDVILRKQCQHLKLLDLSIFDLSDDNIALLQQLKIPFCYYQFCQKSKTPRIIYENYSQLHKTMNDELSLLHVDAMVAPLKLETLTQKYGSFINKEIYSSILKKKFELNMNFQPKLLEVDILMHIIDSFFTNVIDIDILRGIKIPKGKIIEVFGLKQMIIQTIQNHSEFGLQNILLLEIDTIQEFNKYEIDYALLENFDPALLWHFMNVGYDASRILSSTEIFNYGKQILKGDKYSELLKKLIKNGMEAQKLQDEFTKCLLRLLGHQDYFTYTEYLEVLKFRERYILIDETIEEIEKQYSGEMSKYFDKLLDLTNIFTISYRTGKKWIWKYIETQSNVDWERIHSLFIYDHESDWIRFLEDMLLNNGSSSRLDVASQLKHELSLKQINQNFLTGVLDGNEEENIDYEDYTAEFDENDDSFEEFDDEEF